MNEKWVEEGDLSWHLPLGCDHSENLPTRPGLVRVGDLDKLKLCTQPHRDASEYES